MRTVNEALKIAQQVTGYELKDYQQQAIEAYLCGKDVFVSAPTRLRAVSLMLRNRRTVSGEAAMRERRRRDRQTAKQTAGAPAVCRSRLRRLPFPFVDFSAEERLLAV